MDVSSQDLVELMQARMVFGNEFQVLDKVEKLVRQYRLHVVVADGEFHAPDCAGLCWFKKNTGTPEEPHPKCTCCKHAKQTHKWNNGAYEVDGQDLPRRGVEACACCLVPKRIPVIFDKKGYTDEELSRILELLSRTSPGESIIRREDGTFHSTDIFPTRIDPKMTMVLSTHDRLSVMQNYGFGAEKLNSYLTYDS